MNLTLRLALILCFSACAIAGCSSTVSPDASVSDVSPGDSGTEAGTDASSSCGPGTYPSDVVCLPVDAGDGGLPHYDLRIAVDTVTGDGITMVPLTAIGRESDGSPSTRDVIFWLSRAGAGTVTPGARLTATGTTIQFVPCNATASPACIGSVQILMALASAPSTPVATSPIITITDQAAVGTPAPCLVGGNVGFVTGDSGDYISGGRSFTYGAPRVVVNMRTSSYVSVQLGSFGDWMVDFSTQQLSMPLMVGVYENAMRYPFEDAGHAGFSLEGMGGGCNTLTARFQIHTLTTDTAGLLEFTSTFEQHCEGGVPAARGCIHWHR